MKPKKQKQLNKNHSPSFWMLVIVVPILALFCGLSAWIYYEDQKVRHAEDITFTKIETFVNLAKIRLDKEVPEGKWEIDSYCSRPGDKGASGIYGCNYGVITKRANIDAEKLKSLYASTVLDGQLRTTKSEYSNSIGYGGELPFDSTCAMFINVEQSYAHIGCDGVSHTTRYRLNN